jgi:hypothetical protein
MKATTRSARLDLTLALRVVSTMGGTGTSQGRIGIYLSSFSREQLSSEPIPPEPVYAEARPLDFSCLARFKESTVLPPSIVFWQRKRQLQKY